MLNINRLIDKEDLDDKDFEELFKILPIYFINVKTPAFELFPEESVVVLLKAKPQKNNLMTNALAIIDKLSWSETLKNVFIVSLIKSKFPNLPLAYFITGDQGFDDPLSDNVADYQEYLFNTPVAKLYEMVKSISPHLRPELTNLEISLSMSSYQSGYKEIIEKINQGYFNSCQDVLTWAKTQKHINHYKLKESFPKIFKLDQVN